MQSPTMSTGLERDQLAGSTPSSAAIVSGARVASVPPLVVTESAASTPGPPPLVRIASRSPPSARRDSASVSAASNSASTESTSTMPARCRALS
ncbi:MAG: hypothetical protein HONDAALG_02229 [Gammaproteobacteria bacterium]|nr:hypothetical protein [Gammaproteobacteria bacterium]